MREAIDGDALLDEAEVELATAISLFKQIAAISPDGNLYEAKVAVLGEYIDLQVKKRA